MSEHEASEQGSSSNRDLAILRNTYRPKKSRFVQAQSIVVGISVVETRSRPECIMVKPLIDLVPSLLRSANEASTSCPFQLVPSWEEGVVSCCESKVSVLFVGSALGFRTLLFLCVPPLHRKGNTVHFYFVVKSWTDPFQYDNEHALEKLFLFDLRY